MNSTTASRFSLLRPKTPMSRPLLIATGLGALVGGGYGLGLLFSPGEPALMDPAGAAAAAETETSTRPFDDRGSTVSLPATRAHQDVEPSADRLAREERALHPSPLTPLETASSAVEDSLQAPAAEPPTVEPAKLGAYYVQVASFRTRERAQERTQALAAKGLAAQVGPNEGRWHTVRLGPFETRGQAEKQRLALARSERRQAYVVPRSNGLFHVQVASLESEEAAHRVADMYTTAGHATKVSRIRMAGKRWYCVRIGPFDTREEALAYQKLVPDKPGIQSRVIPFEPKPT